VLCSFTGQQIWRRTCRCGCAVVKPQRLTEVTRQPEEAVPSSAVVYQLSLEQLSEKSAKGETYCRGAISMPNTPAQIGEGITVWIALTLVSELQKETARTVLGALVKK